MITSYNKFLNESKYTSKKLNPDFWDSEMNLDEGVREKLVTIAEEFYETIDLDGVEIDDIHLTGSLANYNYNKHSDLDVHITIDMDEYDGDKDVLDNLGKSKAFIWNTKHDIVIRGADVELYVMDKNEKHISTGLYSLKNGEWIKKPEYTDPDVDEKDVQSKYEKWKYEIEKLHELTKDDNLSDEDNKGYLDRAEKLKKKLKNFRKKGLEEGVGEFSTENVAFKKLRNNEIIKKLYDASVIFYDRMFSQ